MTKWICNRGLKRTCREPCYIEYPGSKPKDCLYRDGRVPCWNRYDLHVSGLTPLKDAPPGAFWHLHEANLLEMAGDLKALKERVEKLENGVAPPDYHLLFLPRIKRLEHQMRKHYHNGHVWVENEDGSESQVI